MSDQDIVDMFALLIVGQAELPEGDPRSSLITIATICLQEFVGMTRYAIEKGLLEVAPSNGFEPKFPRSEEDDK